MENTFSLSGKQDANSLKDKTSGVRLTQKQVKDLELLAKKHNSAMSEQIRKAVEGYILIQRVRNSLPYVRKEISQKSTLGKMKLVGGIMKFKKIFLILVFLFLSIPTHAQLHEEEHISKGITYQNSGHIDKALEEYEKALLINPNNTDVLFNAGQMHLKKQEWEKAIIKFQKIINMNPEDGESYYNLALAYYYMGDITNAIQYNNKSQQLGFRGTEKFRSLLESLNKLVKYKEMDFKYRPILDENNKEVILKIKGTITADNHLLRSTIRMIEPLSNVSEKGIFKTVEIKIIKIDAETAKASYEWTLFWNDNSQKVFEVQYLPSSIGGTDIRIKNLGSKN